MSEGDRLLQKSISVNSTKTYATALKAFYNFCSQYSIASALPVSVENLILFISHLSLSGYSSETISTYVSGIGYHHKMNHYHDPTNRFVIRKMLEGSKRDNPTKDKRLPITSNILEQIIASLTSVCTNKYETALFTAAFSLAYFGLLRVSEVAVDSKKSDKWDLDRTLLYNDLLSVNTQNCEIRLKVTKTNQTGPPTVLQIPAVPNSVLCPVSALNAYISVRTQAAGPLFIHYDKSPLTRYQFTSVLRMALKHANIPNWQLYTSHSMRIGCASVAADHPDISDDIIKHIGRWSVKSKAYKRYIRIPACKLVTSLTC